MTRKSRSLRGHKLGIETLEQREVFAGNITTSLLGGTLRIVGDNQANVATLIQGGAVNQVVLAGNGSTQIDGVLASKTFNNVRTISVQLRGGDDSFLVGATLTSSDPLALTGTPLQLTGSLAVDGGNGNDQIGVLARAITIGINGGFGDDQIGLVDSATRAGTNILGGDGAGADQIVVDGVAASSLDIASGSGEDQIDVLDSTANVVNIDAGDELDLVWIDNVDPRSQLSVVLGNGDDAAQIDHIDTLMMSVWGNDGDDDITIDHSNIRTVLGVHVGDGDNVLTVENTTARLANFAGGLGDNYLNETGNTFTRKRVFQIG